MKSSVKSLLPLMSEDGSGGSAGLAHVAVVVVHLDDAVGTTVDSRLLVHAHSTVGTIAGALDAHQSGPLVSAHLVRATLWTISPAASGVLLFQDKTFVR